MNTCKTCIHWKVAYERPDVQCGTCQALGYAHLRFPLAIAFRAVVAIDDGLLAKQGHSRFHTVPDFGCVHWEATEPPISRDDLTIKVADGSGTLYTNGPAISSFTPRDSHVR